MVKNPVHLGHLFASFSPCLWEVLNSLAQLLPLLIVQLAVTSDHCLNFSVLSNLKCFQDFACRFFYLLFFLSLFANSHQPFKVYPKFSLPISKLSPVSSAQLDTSSSELPLYHVPILLHGIIVFCLCIPLKFMSGNITEVDT